MIHVCVWSVRDDVVTQIAGMRTRTATLQQTDIVLEQEKYDLVVNKGHAAVAKCGTSFAGDSQVAKCSDDTVNNFKASLNDKLNQMNAINGEVNTFQYLPKDKINNGVLSCGKYATDAYKNAKVCSGNKL